MEDHIGLYALIMYGTVQSNIHWNEDTPCWVSNVIQTFEFYCKFGLNFIAALLYLHNWTAKLYNINCCSESILCLTFVLLVLKIIDLLHLYAYTHSMKQMLIFLYACANWVFQTQSNYYLISILLYNVLITNTESLNVHVDHF